jgi:hypothetical protein
MGEGDLYLTDGVIGGLLLCKVGVKPSFSLLNYWIGYTCIVSFTIIFSSRFLTSGRAWIIYCWDGMFYYFEAFAAKLSSLLIDDVLSELLLNFLFRFYGNGTTYVLSSENASYKLGQF